MRTKQAHPFQALKSTLPYSRMVFPKHFSHQIKYIIWRVYTPLHPFFRDTALMLRIVKIEKKIERWGSRQRFLLGSIAPGESVESVVRHLVEKGFGNHFVAWEDDGEVVSLRYVEDFATQYHIRVFEDGEVRGHFEYTPECYPYKHYHELDCFEPKQEFFLKVLGEKITPSQEA